MREYVSPVGKSITRIDAYDKVTGRTRYTGDLIPGDALTAKVKHADIANGRVKSIDASKALALPGVVKVVTCFDVPDIRITTSGNPWTTDPDWRDIQDRKLLDDRVRYYGDDVAAVIAADELTAKKALSLIDVEYEVYEPVFEPEEAMNSTGVPIHEEFPDNVLGYNELSDGDYDAVIREEDLVVVDRWYTVPPVKHCQLENPVCCAYRERGKMVVITSTQMPHVLRREIAQALGMPWGQVRVLRPPMGGGFGNKDDALYEPLCAYLSTCVGGRCVKLDLTREEDMTCTRTRHGMKFHLITHVRKDGRIAARYMDSYSNNGAYASHGHAIASKGTLAFSQIYKCDAYKCRAFSVYTNLPAAGAMRGYGMPEITFAMESHTDDVALAIGMDPVKFRRMNMMEQGFVSRDKVLTNYYDSLNQCLDAANAYMEERPETPCKPGHVRGTGTAIFWYKTAVAPICLEGSIVRLLMNQDGSFQMDTGEVDLGQGSDTAFVQMAAERLKTSVDRIHLVKDKDTDVTPYGTGAYASRQTYICGMAIAEAAEEMCQKMLSRAAEEAGIPETSLYLCDGTVYRKEDDSRVMTYEELAWRSAYSRERAEQLIVNRNITCRTNALSLGCTVASVDVDPGTGKVEICDIVNAHDCGVLINPALALGQVHGGVSMGIGYGLTEEMLFDPKTGRMLNDNLLDYKLLTAADHPDRIGGRFVENPEPTSPFGTKALGEPPCVSPAPAIRNAVLAATGAAIDQLPLNPARVLAAIRK